MVSTYYPTRYNSTLQETSIKISFHFCRLAKKLLQITVLPCKILRDRIEMNDNPTLWGNQQIVGLKSEECQRSKWTQSFFAIHHETPWFHLEFSCQLLPFALFLLVLGLLALYFLSYWGKTVVWLIKKLSTKSTGRQSWNSPHGNRKNCLPAATRDRTGDL